MVVEHAGGRRRGEQRHATAFAGGLKEIPAALDDVLPAQLGASGAWFALADPLVAAAEHP